MPGEPSFAEIAASMLEWVRHEARLNEIDEPFMIGLPAEAVGVRRDWAKLQRRALLFAEAQRLFAAMAEDEPAHRALIEARGRDEAAAVTAEGV